MNSFKRSFDEQKAAKIACNNELEKWLQGKEHPIDTAVRKARAKAEKIVFRQKVQAYLIVAGAMIVILLTSFYW